MTSIYTDFANHNESLIQDRARHALAEGSGMGWGREEHTLLEAAEDMGAKILHTYDSGEILCEVSETLFMLCDVNGPWAVEVASERDLGQ